MKRKASTQVAPDVKKYQKGSADRGGRQYGAGGGNPVRQGYNAVTRTSGAAVIGEMKYFDCDCNGRVPGLLTTTWVAGTMCDPDTTINLGAAAVATPLCLFAPTVGAALNQRIGRKVKVLKIKVNGFVNKGAETAQTTANAADSIRLFLVVDQQTNSAQMTGAQLMNDGSAADTVINSFQNPNNFGRFRVLKEKRFLVQNASIDRKSVV